MGIDGIEAMLYLYSLAGLLGRLEDFCITVLMH